MPDRLEPQPDVRTWRMLADGELAGADLLRAQAMLQNIGSEGDQARACVVGERRMRQSVAQVIGREAAPADLRGQIENLLAEGGMVASAVEGDEAAIAGRIGPDQTERRSVGSRRSSTIMRLFASPQRANYAAVAAVLALIAGAVLFGIYGRTIDDVPTPHATVDVVGDVAQYVDTEHGQCTLSLEHIQKEATWHTPADSEVGLTEALGAPVQAFDLSPLGYDFVGAGRCDVPLQQQPSGHLMYRKTVNGKPGPMVSVFMAPVRGCCKSICAALEPGEWSVAKSSCKRRVLYSTDGRLVYFLVCCNENDLAPVGEAISQQQQARSR